MFDKASFRRFLETGKAVAEDAAHWHHRDTLAEHDEKYHGGMFKGGRCAFRQKGDKADILGAKKTVTGRRPDGKAITQQDEYDAVVARYKGTPMWMKAPNGKKTNMTERQWVQVRTPSFKRWFGDWESSYYTKGWFDVEPVSEFLLMQPLDVSSYGRADDKDHIKLYFESFGIVRNLKDGREVRFPAKSAGRFVYVKNYVPSFKKLFETSMRAWSENETKFEGHKEHSNILRYHHYLNKFETADGEYFVRFTVREGASDAAEGSNLVHAANISEVEVYKKKVAQTDTLDRSATSSAGHLPHVDYKIANYLNGVNGASVSKVVDENGEPMVVWKGGAANVSEFHLTGDQYGFFADDRDVASYFCREDKGEYKPKAFFINVRNPFVVDAAGSEFYSVPLPDDELRKLASKKQLERRLKMERDIGSHDYVYDRKTKTHFCSTDEIAALVRDGIGGYDGLVVKDVYEGDDGEAGMCTDYVPVIGNQVKSATDNSGAFSNDEVSTLDEADAAEVAAEKYLRMVEG